VYYFLKMGYDVNSLDKYNRTCLMLACLCDHEEYGLRVSKLLLSFGADVNIRDSSGQNVLYLALSEKREKLFEYVLEKHSNDIDFSSTDSDGNVLINHAALHGTFKMLKNLIAKMNAQCAEIDQRNLHGYTALLLAIKNDKYLNAYALLKYGCCSATLRDNEKRLNALEWLLHKIKQNKKTILNSKSLLELESKLKAKSIYALSRSTEAKLLLRRKLALRSPNCKSWYAETSQYFQSSNQCDHIKNPNYSIEHKKSKYIPFILKTSVNVNINSRIQVNRHAATRNEDFMRLNESNTNPKEIVLKLYHLIVSKMSESFRQIQKTPSERTSSLCNNASSKKNSPFGEESSIDLSLYFFDEAASSPSSSNSLLTVKDNLHNIFNMYMLPLSNRSKTQHTSLSSLADYKVKQSKIQKEKSSISQDSSERSDKNNSASNRVKFNLE
jgi:hypothetical protein